MLESILIRVINWLTRQLPDEHSAWCEALLAESSAITRAEERLRWIAGGVAVALRTYAANRIRGITTDLDGQRLPAALLLVAGYQCIFSLALVLLLVFQLPSLRASWTDAVPALSISFFLAIIPGVLGFGLLILDEAARWGTVAFSAAHAVLAWHRISITSVDPILPAFRIALDMFIIITLIHPVIVHRFRDRPLRLNLY